MVNCFSFCLYGDRPKYTIGMCRNVQLINQFYPDWRIYIAIGLGVPDDIIDVLGAQPNVVLYKTGMGGGVNMFYRFFVLDNDDVDVMVVRDADSRIHARDRWCINRWLALAHEGRGAMATRDHVCHNTPILGGLWGIRKGVLPGKVRDFFPSLEADGYEFKYEDDQIALSERVYPLLVKAGQLVVFTDIPQRVFQGEYSEKIGEPLAGHNFCGQVVDFNDAGQEFISMPYLAEL